MPKSSASILPESDRFFSAASERFWRRLNAVTAVVLFLLNVTNEVASGDQTVWTKGSFDRFLHDRVILHVPFGYSITTSAAEIDRVLQAQGVSTDQVFDAVIKPDASECYISIRVVATNEPPPTALTEETEAEALQTFRDHFTQPDPRNGSVPTRVDGWAFRPYVEAGPPVTFHFALNLAGGNRPPHVVLSSMLLSKTRIAIAILCTDSSDPAKYKQLFDGVVKGIDLVTQQPLAPPPKAAAVPTPKGQAPAGRTDWWDLLTATNKDGYSIAGAVIIIAAALIRSRNERRKVGDVVQKAPSSSDLNLSADLPPLPTEEELDH